MLKNFCPHRWTILGVSVLMLGLVAAPSSVSASARAISASTDVATTSANGGGSFTVTAGVPVAAPGTVS